MLNTQAFNWEYYLNMFEGSVVGSNPSTPTRNPTVSLAKARVNIRNSYGNGLEVARVSQTLTSKNGKVLEVKHLGVEMRVSLSHKVIFHPIGEYRLRNEDYLSRLNLVKNKPKVLIGVADKLEVITKQRYRLGL